MSEKLNQMRIETHSKSAAHVARSTNNLGSPLAQRSCPMIDNMPRCKRVFYSLVSPFLRRERSS
jgi:hypothetical protein